jgi:serralysin
MLLVPMSVLGITLALSSPMPAQEPVVSTVAADGPALIFTAGDGLANRLTVWMDQSPDVDDGYYYGYLLDDVHPIAAGANCAHPDADDLTRVACRLEVFDSRDPYVTGRFRLRDGNDSLRFHNDSDQAYYSNEFWMGSGNDKAVTRQPGRVIDGSGVWGQDDSGGAFGGNGRDTVHAYGNTWVRGGNGNDKLYGDDAYQSINGDDGNDLIDAGGSGETLAGGKGNDTIYGRAGADHIFGNSGNDRLYGGRGNDTISGGPGKDFIKHD